MRLPVCCLLFALAACGNEVTPDPFVATWELDTFNGQSLPVTQGGSTILSETLVLNADHTWEDATQRQTAPNAFTWSYGTGTWTRTDSVSVSLTPGNGFTFVGKLGSPTSLSVEWLGESAHYRR